jgi:uncharacterized protein YggE
MIRQICPVLIIVLFLALNINAQVIGDSFIIIDADSRVEIPANEISYSISLEQVDTSAVKAYQGIKYLEAELLPLLKKFNMPDTNISYSLVSVFRISAFNNQPGKYRASEIIVVKLYDFKQNEPFQFALLSIGISTFHETFSATNLGDARDKGIDQVLDEAKKQAEIISDKLGRKLGKVLEVESTNSNSIMRPSIEGQYLIVGDQKLIDIPQHVTLYVKLKVKYELE